MGDKEKFERHNVGEDPAGCRCYTTDENENTTRLTFGNVEDSDVFDPLKHDEGKS